MPIYANLTQQASERRSRGFKLAAVEDLRQVAKTVNQLEVRLPSGQLLFNDAEILRWLGEILMEAEGAAQPAPAPVLSQSEQESIETEKREIEALMRTNRAEYSRDTKTQERYREILEGSATPRKGGSQSGPTPEQELRKIQALMRSRNSKYWRGPESAQLQKRYRELVGSTAIGSGCV